MVAFTATQIPKMAIDDTPPSSPAVTTLKGYRFYMKLSLMHSIPPIVLYLHHATTYPDRKGGDGFIGGWGQGFTGLEAESCAMAGAYYLIAFYIATCQAVTIVTADVLNGIEFTTNLEDCDLTDFCVYDFPAVRRYFICCA
jgi:hypothetical protein